MTTVGKILVVLHLVLSVMFMAFAGAVYTAQTNWRASQKTTADALAKANTKMRDMQSEFDKTLADLTDKKNRLENDVITLKGVNKALDAQVITFNADNTQLRKEVDQLRDMGALTTTEAGERKTEADLQRGVNGDLYTSRENFVQKLNDTEDERFKLALEIQRISEKYEQLLNDNKVMKSFLGSKKLTTDPKEMVVQTTPPPPLNGRVTDVRKADRGSREYIEISLGSDSGLVAGHRLTVFHGDRWLGDIRLTLVEADKAVGYVDRRAKNATFQVDDEVTTRF